MATTVTAIRHTIIGTTTEATGTSVITFCKHDFLGTEVLLKYIVVGFDVPGLDLDVISGVPADVISGVPADVTAVVVTESEKE
jgi:hypothetical protein